MSLLGTRLPGEYCDLDHARAKSVDDVKLEPLWSDDRWIAEEKLDGWRMMMHLGRDLARPYFTGRRTSDVTGRLSEKGELLRHLWPDHADVGYTVLDGELMPPLGATFHDMASMVNSDPETSARVMERIGRPRLVVFDVLVWDGRDMRGQPYDERRSELELRPAIRGLIDGLPEMSLAVVREGEDKCQWYEQIVTAGGEGVILKDVNAVYGRGWIKVKKTSTLDVVVTGFEPGRGKYEGQVGSAIVSVYGSSGQLLEVGAVSGMTDAVRLHMTTHPGEWVGHAIEIVAQEWAQERLRHPRFSRRRDDVDPSSCTLAKMRRDLGVPDERRLIAETPRQQLKLL